MKKRFLSLGLVVVMVTSLIACGGSNAAKTVKATETAAMDTKAEGSEAADATVAGGVLRIGGIGPVTGGVVVYGVAVRHGAEPVVKEINEARGINSVQIEFNFQGDEYNTEKSVSAYNTLENWGMQVLMGTVTSVLRIVVADKITADSMFQTAPSGSAIEYTVNPNVFRIYFSNPDQGAASVKYIDEDRLASKVAVIYDSSDVCSSGTYEKFVKESANQGIGIVATEAFTVDNNRNFSTQLQKSKDAGVELVFLPIYYTETPLILQQAGTMGFAPQLFGCDGMDGILQVENFDTKLAEGFVLPTSFAANAIDNLTVRFVDSYRAVHNEVPVQFAVDAYDAIYAIKVTIGDANVIPDANADTVCDALKASMLSIKPDDLADEGMAWTRDDESHKTLKAVKVADEAYTAMQSAVL